MNLLDWDWSLDGWIIAAGVLCAVSAALLGNFLVLRKMSMLGDAISHAVLPGLAAAFFISGTRDSLPMFAGAAVVGVLTAVFTEWIRGYGRVDEGAAMGVVFTSLFAAGLVMIVQAADRVDLDPGCVLYGSIEMTPLNTLAIGSWEIPRVVVVLSVVLAINLTVVLLFYKEFKLTSFDPELATTLGFRSSWMHYLLMMLVAVTSVACFESVGSILVVAMFVVPPATAYLCTDRLPFMIALSVVFAALSAVLGHIGAMVVPRLIGFDSTTTAGMMAVAAGLFFLVAFLFAPRYGVIVAGARRGWMSLRILTEDVLALLYRAEEPARRFDVADLATIRQLLVASAVPTTVSLLLLRLRGDVVWKPQGYQLSARGRARAQALVRAHRLWEQYLVTKAGVAESRIHVSAEQLEHFTDRELRGELDRETVHPRADPHGAPIPPE